MVTLSEKAASEINQRWCELTALHSVQMQRSLRSRNCGRILTGKPPNRFDWYGEGMLNG